MYPRSGNFKFNTQLLRSRYREQAISAYTSKKVVLPVNEYLNAVIIIKLSIKLPLLAAWHTSFACPKEVSRKRHPTMPALWAPLRCSPVAGRQKLADAQTGLASFYTTGCAAQRHRMGNSTPAHTCPGTRYPDEPKKFKLSGRTDSNDTQIGKC